MEKIYKIHLNHMKENESNVIKFLAILFTAIGGFFTVVKTNHCNDKWLLIAAIGATIILFWGILYTLSMAYTHRYLQILMYHYEKELKLPNFKNWEPNKFGEWGCKESIFWEIAPGPYKSHLIGFSISIAFIWFAFLQLKIFLPWYYDILILLGIFVVEWLLITLLSCHYISKLKKLK